VGTDGSEFLLDGQERGVGRQRPVHVARNQVQEGLLVTGDVGHQPFANVDDHERDHGDSQRDVAGKRVRVWLDDDLLVAVVEPAPDLPGVVLPDEAVAGLTALRQVDPCGNIGLGDCVVPKQHRLEGPVLFVLVQCPGENVLDPIVVEVWGLSFSGQSRRGDRWGVNVDAAPSHHQDFCENLDTDERGH
jgi:hypothetical protein